MEICDWGENVEDTQVETLKLVRLDSSYTF